jgi:DNA modification methylase
MSANKQEFLNGQIVLYNCDCLDVMRDLKDKEIDLVLTDPPYGINYGKQLKNKGDGNGGSNKYGWKNYGCPEWDKEIPKAEVFNQFFRISKNQIIWGGNYMTDNLKPSQCWLVWDKGQRDFSLADGEMAWTSFDKAMRIFTYARAKALQDGKIHPTQKPVALMAWCLNNYSQENDLIFDGFLGSGTTAIASIRTKRRLIGCELDNEYFDKMCKRIEEELRQGNLF